MSVFFGLRFDFRNPTVAGVTHADRYAAALEMAEWADRLGAIAIAVSEHHGSADGYVPSPLPIIAAMAARTTTVRFSVAALIAPFYEPIRLAEDLIVLDHLSRGRVDPIVGAGYVASEFDLYGVDRKQRGRRVEETVATLRAAFAGELGVTPEPYRPGGPPIVLGGSGEAAARRAARIADGFLPSVPEAWDFYRDEVQKLGRPDPGPSPVGRNRTVALADDVDKGWLAMGPYFLHESNAYGAWLAADGMGAPYREADDVDELRASGDYAVLTPDDLVAELKSAPFPLVFFHPMCGGIPPELAWASLRLFEREVLPAFA